MSFTLGKCPYCFYTSDKKYNLKRHIKTKHKDKKNRIKIKRRKKKIVLVQQNIKSNKEKDILKEHECSKCNKKYKTKRFLEKHEEKCDGLDILTCYKCMKVFSSKSSKSRHINNVNCTKNKEEDELTKNIKVYINKIIEIINTKKICSNNIIKIIEAIKNKKNL